MLQISRLTGSNTFGSHRIILHGHVANFTFESVFLLTGSKALLPLDGEMPEAF
jgi:hypothetical protein